MPDAVNPYHVQPPISQPVQPRPGEQDPGAIQAGRRIEQAHDTAKAAIRKAYLSHGGAYPIGVFGKPNASMTQTRAGHYEQGYDWGKITVDTTGAEPATTMEMLFANISIAAVKCFGTDDHDDDGDETYILVSVRSPADAFIGSMGVGKTWRSPIQEHTVAKKVILANTMVQEFRDIPVGTAGLYLHWVVMDHEYGSPEEARAKLQKWIDAGSKDYKDAAQRLKDAGVTGLPADDISNSSVLDLIEQAVLEKVSGLFADDEIGETTLNLDPTWLRSIVTDEGHQASRVDQTTDLGSIFVNVPRQQDNPYGYEWLLSNGDGSYKVYFNVDTYLAQRTG